MDSQFVYAQRQTEDTRMFAKLIACTLSLAVLGCLMLGCSDDTQRITSPGNAIQSNPLSTAIDGSNGQTEAVVDTGYVYYPYDTAVDEDWPDPENPMDRFNNDDSGSDKPIDNVLDRE